MTLFSFNALSSPRRRASLLAGLLLVLTLRAYGLDDKAEPPAPPDPILDVIPADLDLLQSRLASSSSSSSLLLKQTRIDRAFFKYVPGNDGKMVPELHLTGICLAENFNTKDVREKVTTGLEDILFGVGKETDPSKWLYSKWGDQAKLYDKDKKERLFNLEISGIVSIDDPKKHPRVVLQKLLNGVKPADTFEGVLINGISYDGKGRALIEGLAATNTQLALIESELEKLQVAATSERKPEDKPGWLRKEKPGQPAPWDLNLASWDSNPEAAKRLSPVALLQSKLANRDPQDNHYELGRQTLIRSVRFTNDAVPAQCTIEASCVAIPKLDAKQQDENPLLLHTIFENVCKEEIWKNVKPRLPFVFALNPAVDKKLTILPNPVFRLQALSNEDEDLDGMLIEKVNYDAQGMLILHGFVSKEGDKAKVKKLLQTMLKDTPALIRQAAPAKP